MKTKSKTKKTRTYKVKDSQTIFISPDNGATVYMQNPDGTRGDLVFESHYTKYDRQATRESYLSDPQACYIRDQYPALKDAWNQYKTLWNLTVTDDDLNFPLY